MPQKKSKRGSRKPARKTTATKSKARAKVKRAAKAKRAAPKRRAKAVKSPARVARVKEERQRERPEPEREHEEAETLIPGAAGDDLAEELGEETVEAATSGQAPAEDNLNAEVPEETGGPFVETSISAETGHRRDTRKK